MSDIITYEYVKEILDKISLDNKLTLVQFQTIFSYLYKKVQINIKLIKKKTLITRNLNLVTDVINKLELTIQQGLIAEPEYKDTMLGLINDLKKEVKDWYGHSS
jgi:hypothetical protein